MAYSIKPCPFCGNSVSPAIYDENLLNSCDCVTDNPYYAVVCSINEPPYPVPNWEKGCGASGGFAKTELGAVNLWNLRAGCFIDG